LTSAEEAVQSGASAISGGANAGNSQTGAISKSFTATPSENFAAHLEQAISPNAYATVGCGQFAVQDACSSGSKSANYVNCLTWGGVINGSIDLTYSSATCAMATGNSLIRKVNLTRDGIFGATITTDSTNPSTAYDGTAVGAGATITNTGSGTYTYSLDGVHKVRTTPLGKTAYDVNVMTSSPMTLSGSLSGNRTVDGGSVVVYHNLAKYTAIFTPHNLSYNSATCCHPTSGTLDVSYSGSVNGGGSVSFNSTCGLVTLTLDGESQEVNLHGCE
jgi:hypothetical protein